MIGSRIMMCVSLEGHKNSLGLQYSTGIISAKRNLGVSKVDLRLLMSSLIQYLQKMLLNRVYGTTVAFQAPIISIYADSHPFYLV